MQDSIKIALVQADLLWDAVDKNLQKFDVLLASAETDTDLIVLPEMFATAFTVNPNPKKISIGSIPLKWLKNKAKKLQKIIVGSILFEENNKFYNRLFWMFPNGDYRYYDKRHLFQMGNEHQTITPGEKRIIISYKNTKFLLQICYDLRFPVASRNTYNATTNTYNYDVIIYVANWPEVRKNAYLPLLQARAIENQAYVLWVNRVGIDNHGLQHSGDTQVLSPTGKVLTKAPDYTEKLIHHCIDTKQLKEVRENFKVGLDWDDFTMH